MTHTPGPWTMSGGINGEWLITDSDDWSIGMSFGSVGHDCGEEQSDANARLMAAAPDLLAALRSALIANERVLPSQDEPEWARQSREAIAKAQAQSAAQAQTNKIRGTK